MLATDGSPDALVAARTAVELSGSTGSELHVVHVGEFLPTYLAFTEEEPTELRRRAREVLDAQAKRIKGEGGSVAEAHLRGSGAPPRRSSTSPRSSTRASWSSVAGAWAR